MIVTVFQLEFPAQEAVPSLIPALPIAFRLSREACSHLHTVRLCVSVL